MGISEQAQEILDELYKVNPENLNEKARKLFDTVMSIADSRDLYKNRLNNIEKYIRYWNKKGTDETTMLILNDILLIINGNSDMVVRLKGNDD